MSNGRSENFERTRIITAATGTGLPWGSKTRPAAVMRAGRVAESPCFAEARTELPRAPVADYPLARAGRINQPAPVATMARSTARALRL